jgi:hypothetical protein
MSKLQFPKVFLGLLASAGLVFAEQPELAKSAPAAQITGWIAQLSDSDYAKRKAAVQSLATQPVAALPLLRQQLKNDTDTNHRWWLNVAIQECEAKCPKPGEISANPDAANGLIVGEACKSGDGLFAVVEREGVRCWEVPKKGFYLYFSASPDFREKAYTALDIELEYLDTGTGRISLDYDSTNPRAAFNGAYENHSTVIRRTDSGQWRKKKFHLPNARFRGSENGQTDFRFNNDGDDMVIRSVRVWPTNAKD